MLEKPSLDLSYDGWVVGRGGGTFLLFDDDGAADGRLDIVGFFAVDATGLVGFDTGADRPAAGAARPAAWTGRAAAGAGSFQALFTSLMSQLFVE